MQILNQALAMSALDRARFAYEERQRAREFDRANAPPNEQMVKAEQKRARRRERNLLHCS